MRRMRFDLFICFLITIGILYGVLTIGEKIGVVDKMGDLFPGFMDPQINEVPDGEVGGYATVDTPRISNVEELLAVAQCDNRFTVETRAVKYLNMGTFVGGGYEWRILELSDNSCFAVKLNTHNIIENENSMEQILPVGTLIMAEPETLEQMKVAMQDAEGNFYLDAYIDMDGATNATYINSVKMGGLKAITWILYIVMPVLALAIILFMVFIIHRIFVKFKIFPPVFAEGKW